MVQLLGVPFVDVECFSSFLFAYTLFFGQLFYLKNWHKYNWTSSPKVITCILNEYKNIKSETLKAYIDSLLIQYEYSIDTVCIQKHNKNKNKNKEKEEENKIIDISKQKKEMMLNKLKRLYETWQNTIFQQCGTT